jgi:CBS domain-containing protein
MACGIDIPRVRRSQSKEARVSGSSVEPTRGSYLLPQFEHATVADAMHPGILSCDADATLTEVARMMSTHHVHSVAVRGAAEGQAGESVWGIISDFDVLRAGMRQDPPDTAAELGQQPIINVETSTALRDAADLMITNMVSHVVAVDPETQRPVGILSTLDIAGVLAWGEL